MSEDFSQYLSSIEEIIEDARQGKMFILVDDEDRENEGDLVIPAEQADADAVNFMAKFGRGLICLTMTGERIEQLRLPLMTAQNGSRHETAFTLSIEAKEGVTTGISAADRAKTIEVAIDPTKNHQDIHTPGHVFPLRARDGGVLVRAGHTEASVDISRLAGMNPSGVICEIMNDDGTMARMPDLVQFAQFHNLKIATIADLIAYRRQHDNLVEQIAQTTLHSEYGGEFKMFVYANKIAYAEHVALVKGDVTDSEDPVLVRMHALNVLDDVLGDTSSGKATELHSAMRIIAEKGRGVIVLIREPQRSSLSEGVQNHASGNGKKSSLREYGVGAQILLDLGVRDMVLLSNTKRNIIGLDGYGLKVVDQHPIPK